MKAKLVLCLALAACSSSESKSDGGADASTNTDGGGGANQVTQSGVMAVYSTNAPIDADITVSTGATTKAAADGKYAFKVEKGKPFTYAFSADGHTKSIEEEVILSGDAVRDGTLVPSSLQGIVRNSLPMFDTMKAALILGPVKKSSCASSAGMIVEIEPPQASAKVVYFGGQLNLPDKNLTSAEDGKRVIIYNLDPKTAFSVKVSWASADGGATVTPCKKTAFPVVDPDKPTVTYTGKYVLEGGDAVSYARVFLE